MFTFFKDLFPILPPLVFDFSKPLRDKIVIYTDASCSAKLCVLDIVFFIDGQSFRLRKELQGRILRCFKSNLRIINQLELLAKLCSVLTLGSKQLHLQLAKLQVSDWFEWVPSLANITDLPSRIETTREITYYKSLDIQGWLDTFQLPTPDTVAYEDLDSLKWLTGG